MNEDVPHVLKWKWVYFPLIFIVFSVITDEDGQPVLPSISWKELGCENTRIWYLLFLVLLRLLGIP